VTSFTFTNIIPALKALISVSFKGSKAATMTHFATHFCPTPQFCFLFQVFSRFTLKPDYSAQDDLSFERQMARSA